MEYFGTGPPWDKVMSEDGKHDYFEHPCTPMTGDVTEQSSASPHDNSSPTGPFDISFNDLSPILLD